MHHRKHIDFDLNYYADAQYMVEAYVEYAVDKVRSEYEAQIEELQREIRDLEVRLGDVGGAV